MLESRVRLFTVLDSQSMPMRTLAVSLIRNSSYASLFGGIGYGCFRVRTQLADITDPRSIPVGPYSKFCTRHNVIML